MIKYLVTCLKPNVDNSIENFKLELGKYNNFFDGKRQQDAYECLVLFLEVLHVGTKTCLINDDGNLHLEEDLFTSVTKKLFMSTTKTTFKCIYCGHYSCIFSEGQSIFINPIQNKTVSELMINTFSGTVTKFCIVCNTDTVHEEKLNMEQPPKILTIVINRFDSYNSGRKNDTPIIIDKITECNGCSFQLLALIDHHGICTSSGHYTSKIFYPDIIYSCNDSAIKEVTFNELSNSVYILFYTLR